MRLALVPGHTPESPGAKRGEISEYGLTSAIIGDLIFRLDKEGHEAILIGCGTNAEQAMDINGANVDFGLELHFNSHKDSSMRGTEVLHSGGPRGILLAEEIQKSLVRTLDTRDRGIVMGYYKLDKRAPLITIVRNTRCPFVVVEPLFLSNDKDFDKIDIQLISMALFEGVVNYGSS